MLLNNSLSPVCICLFKVGKHAANGVGIVYEGWDCLFVAQSGAQWRDLVSTVMSF
jgi:hypothetical protein